MTQHLIYPDGYCQTCQMARCVARERPNKAPEVQTLVRIEMKLNRLLRAAGLLEDE